MAVNGFPASGTDSPDLAPLDQMMTQCLTEHHVPGAALAVSKDGHLVYARGFGWADLQTLEPVVPESLFRIASLSKPLTAVAVMHLAQTRRLSLDDKVFDLLQVTPHLEPGVQPDPRLRQVSVRHLLQHTGGWNRDKSGDPMFLSVAIAEALGVPAPAEPEHIIRWVTGRTLDSDPGQAYAYSNFGYCLLGRIIEKLTGQAYENYVQSAILAPLGITNMRIGSTHMAGRLPGEVVYYPLTDLAGSVFQANLGQRVPANYGNWYLEAMDAHGGWVGCAPDLVKFASALDDPDRCPLLDRQSIETMFERPAPPVGLDEHQQPMNSFYACGWSVDLRANGRPGQQNHNGMLPGTAAVLRRRDDGICWAALFNTAHGCEQVYLGTIIVDLMDAALARVENWPSGGGVQA